MVTFGAQASDTDDDGYTRERGVEFGAHWLPVFEQQGGPSDAELAAFVQAVYQDDVLVVFDWPEWRDQGHVLLETSGAMERADLLELRKVITMLVRQERFAEGTLSYAVSHGWLHAVLQRMATLGVS